MDIFGDQNSLLPGVELKSQGDLFVSRLACISSEYEKGDEIFAGFDEPYAIT